MILNVLAYSYVFYSFWVVFTLETRGSGANLVYKFWNFAQVKLWCQADCEQSEKYLNREFHLKLGRVNFPL